LKKKGFTVIEAQTQPEFLRQMPHADVVWVISTSGVQKEKRALRAAIKAYHEDGGGLFIWGDNGNKS
jgi:hypothetical protein